MKFKTSIKNGITDILIFPIFVVVTTFISEKKDTQHRQKCQQRANEIGLELIGQKRFTDTQNGQVK